MATSTLQVPDRELLQRACEALGTAHRMGEAIGTLVGKLEDTIAAHGDPEDYSLLLALEACIEKHQTAVRPVREAVDEVIVFGRGGPARVAEVSRSTPPPPDSAPGGDVRTSWRPRRRADGRPRQGHVPRPDGIRSPPAARYRLRQGKGGALGRGCWDRAPER